jgi:hypothetical protein
MAVVTAPNKAPVVDPDTGMVTDAWLNYFVNMQDGGGIAGFTNVQVTRTFNGGAASNTLDVSIDASRLTGTTLATNVVNSSLTGVGTLLSGATGRGFTVDLSRSTVTGNIGWANMPTGAGTWTSQPTIIGLLTVNGGIRVLDNIEPQQNFRSNLGKINAKFLSLYCAELFVETLVAQDVMATIGGRVLVGTTTSLTADLSPSATSITVKHNNLSSGHRVRMEANGNVEWMQITSAASGTAGAYVYTVTRNLDGSGANQWFIGDAVFSTGNTGAGFIDLYSTAGIISGTGPTIVGNVRFSPNYVDIAPRWAIGNLNGLYGYVADTYGVAFGDNTKAWVKIDPTNGVRIGHNTTTTLQLDASGNASFAAGAVTIDFTGIELSTDTGGYAGAHAYRWHVPTGELGLGGVETSGSLRELLSLVRWTGAGSYTCQNVLWADYAPISGGTASSATVTALASNTGSIIDLQAGTLQTTANAVSFSGTRSGQALVGIFNASATGYGLSVSAGSTSAHNTLEARDYTGSTSLFSLRGDGSQRLLAAFQQGAGGYVYPGSFSGLSAYQSSFYLASHSTYGLYTNAGMHAVSGYYERSRTTPMGEWAAYTPTWTNLNVNNGTVTARYTQIGKTVFVSIVVVFGSTTSVFGSVSVSLPVSNIAGSVQANGWNYYFDSSGGVAYFGSNSPASATTVALLTLTSPAGNVNATAPFTWANADQMFIWLQYEGV